MSQALAAHDIVTPFPIQSLVVPAALGGGDVLAKSPTGSGKTLAFGVPIVDRISPEDGAPAALILVPTRELAGQVTEALTPIAKAKGLRVDAAYGGTPVHKGAKRIKGAHVLVATPGRLFDLIERRLVKLHQVRILVLDEADRMLDMGFKPQVDRIVKHLDRERQTMLFSATLDGEVGELARAYTRDPGRFEAQPPEGARRRHHRAPVRVGLAGRQGRRADRRARGRARAWRSCSCGRGAAPTGSPRSSSAATSPLWRCTATWLRAPASALSPGSTRAR